MSYVHRAPGKFAALSSWPNMAARQPAFLIPFPSAITTEPITQQVNVPTSGSPVPLATTRTPCCRIFLGVTSANTGLTFVGVPGLDQATGANVMVALPAYTSAPNTSQGQWAAWCGADEELDLADYVIDAAISGEGLSLTYWPR